jgi:NAD(P)-dependent dehydrogenase (short-subunit alcohol dehydrogenase family)
MTTDISAAVEELGHLDVVVANAAICTMTPYDQVTSQMWRNEIDVNLTGTWNTVMATVSHLSARGGGSVILVSSAAGLRGLPFLSPYVAAKHGVTGLTKALAIELGELMIRVNSIHPGSVDTPMQGGREAVQARLGPLFDAHPQWRDKFTNMLAIPYLESEDLSNAVLFLASDEARYITGQALPVDAGMWNY